jgi:sugar phosphate isomerase/epimerase
VRCGQLGVHGTADVGPEAQQAWKAALEKHGITVVTAFPGFAGESYESIPICAETVGFVPAATRAEREERTYRVSDFAKALGIPGMASHIGCLPHDRSHPDYTGVRDLMQRVCDYCAKNGQTFALETGQEPADNLLQFLRDVGRDNLGINFDPANLILYGFGGPLEALDLVKDHLLTVHCKDGSFPAAKGEWGKETPLGAGDVGMDRFVAKLKEIGYTGPLTIEREIVGDAQRADILGAIALLERLRVA